LGDTLTWRHQTPPSNLPGSSGRCSKSSELGSVPDVDVLSEEIVVMQAKKAASIGKKSSAAKAKRGLAFSRCGEARSVGAQSGHWRGRQEATN
jgi:hypothetical protein